MNNWPAIWSPVGLSGLSAVQFLCDSVLQSCRNRAGLENGQELHRYSWINRLTLFLWHLEGFKYSEFHNVRSLRSSDWPDAKHYSPTGKVTGVQAAMMLCDPRDQSPILADIQEAIKLGRL